MIANLVVANSEGTLSDLIRNEFNHVCVNDNVMDWGFTLNCFRINYWIVAYHSSSFVGRVTCLFSVSYRNMT